LLSCVVVACTSGATEGRGTPAVEDGGATYDAGPDAPLRPDASGADADGDGTATVATLHTFMSFGGNPTGSLPGGSCWFAAGNVGETPTLGLCVPQIPSVSLVPTGQPGAGEIRIAGLCLQAPTGGLPGNVTLEVCDGRAEQLWGFEGGRIESNPSGLGATACLVDSGGDNPDNLAVGARGCCAVEPTGRNLWMPVGMPLLLESVGPSGTPCLEAPELDGGTGSEAPDLGSCAPAAAGARWQYSMSFGAAGTISAWTSLADDRALQASAADADGSGATAVTLAPARGTADQFWGFAPGIGAPVPDVLFETNLDGGGSCLATRTHDAGASPSLLVVPCAQDAAVESEATRLWYPLLVGFPR
jgi:hypothetical protein